MKKNDNQRAFERERGRLEVLLQLQYDHRSLAEELDALTIHLSSDQGKCNQAMIEKGYAPR
jgi:hypothetical protein